MSAALFKACYRIWAIVFLIVAGLCVSLPCHAATETNDGVIAGDWDGTVNNDLYTNNGTIGGVWDMTQGGSDRLVNTGTVTGPTFCGVNNDAVEAVGGAVFGGVVFGNTGTDTLIMTGVNSFSRVFQAGAFSFEYGEITPNGTTSIDANVEIADQTDIHGGTVEVSAEFRSDDIIVHNNGTLAVTSSGTVIGNVDSDADGLTFTLDGGGRVGGWVCSQGPSNMNINGLVVNDVVGNYYGTGNTTIQIGSTGIIGGSVGGLVAATGSVNINNAGHIVGVLVGSDSSTGDVNITNSGVVEVFLIGIASGETATIGSGSATLVNTATGEVGLLFCGNMGSNGDVTIINDGTVYSDFVGMTIGQGDVDATNNGRVWGDFVGVEGGAGNATLSNTNQIDGGYYGNFGGAGNVHMTNTGDVGDVMVGANLNTGNVTIVNHGDVAVAMFGHSGGTGDVDLTNTGTVGGHLYGIWEGTGSVILNNSGTVGGNLYGNLDGTGNCTVTNSGTVSGDLIAGSGNDSVTLTETSSVGGNVDGGAGTDTLVFDVDTTLTINDTSPYLNFENARFSGNGTIILADAFDFSSGPVVVDGTLTVAANGSFQAGSLDVNSVNSLNINGAVTVSGETTVDGTLNVNSGGTLTTGTMSVSSGNTANISGVVDVSGGSDVAGTLNVNSGGQLNTASLDVSGMADVSGTANVTGSTTVGGNATVGGSFDTASLNVSGTARINGEVSVADSTIVYGSLVLGNGGTLSSSSLNVASGGSASLGGSAAIDGATTVAGNMNVSGSLSTGSLGVSSYAAITGSVNSGSTDVSGALVVNGSLTSPTVDVGSGGVVSGSGTINGNVSNTGGIAPGNSIGILQINGAYTHQSGATYYCEITSDGQSDLIIADSAMINGGALATYLPVDLYTGNMSWTVITAASGVYGNFDTVTGGLDSAVLSLATRNSGTAVELVLARTAYEQLAANEIQRAVGRTLDSVVPLAAGNTDDLANLIVKMDFEYDLGQIQQAMGAMAPVIYDAFGGSGHSAAGMFDQTLRHRADDLRLRRALGLAGPDKAEGPLLAMADEHRAAGMLAGGAGSGDWRVWARAVGNWSDASGGGGRLGYDTSSGGGVFGADGEVLPWLTAGFGLGYSSTSIGWDAGCHSGDQTGLHYGAYATARWGGWYADAAASYASYSNDAERGINFEDVSATAKADFDSSLWMARLGGGYDLHSGALVWGPVLWLAYGDYQQDGFRENGAGGLGLNVADLDQSGWNSSLGLRLAGLWQAGSISLLPKASLMWLHNFDDDARVISATFRDYGNASPMSLNGIDPYADGLAANLGLSANINGRFNAFVDYGYFYADNYNGHTITAGIDWRF